MLNHSAMMKAIQLKRHKVFILVFVILALLLFILKFKSSSVRNYDRFNNKRGRMQHRKYFDYESELVHAKRPAIERRSRIESPNGLSNAGDVLEYQLSKEELDKKYEANLVLKNEDDIVDFIPPRGKKYMHVNKNFDAPTLQEDAQNKLNENFEQTKASNVYNDFVVEDVDGMNVTPKKEEVDGGIESPKVDASVFKKNLPVFNIPRKKTNVLLEERFKKMHNIDGEGVVKSHQGRADEATMDYDNNAGDDVEVELQNGEEFSLVHNFLASKVIGTPPNRSSLPASVPRHHYIFSAHRFLPWCH